MREGRAIYQNEAHGPHYNASGRLANQSLLPECAEACKLNAGKISYKPPLQVTPISPTQIGKPPIFL